MGFRDLSLTLVRCLIPFFAYVYVSSVPPKSMSSIRFRQWGVSPTILNMASSKKSCEYFVQIPVNGDCNFPKVC